jgi:hypothetical protein
MGMHSLSPQEKTFIRRDELRKERGHNPVEQTGQKMLGKLSGDFAFNMVKDDPYKGT